MDHCLPSFVAAGVVDNDAAISSTRRHHHLAHQHFAKGHAIAFAADRASTPPSINCHSPLVVPINAQGVGRQRKPSGVREETDLGSVQAGGAAEVGLGSRTPTNAAQPRQVLPPSCSSWRMRRPFITSWGPVLIQGCGRPAAEMTLGSVQAGGAADVGLGCWVPTNAARPGMSWPPLAPPSA